MAQTVTSFIFVFVSFITLNFAFASPLQPLKLDHPRDTLQSFYEAMEAYRKGLASENKYAQKKILDAVRCLNLKDINPVIREETGRQVAIQLKEVLDRVIVLDYDKVPDDPKLNRWRLKGTEIVIAAVTEGDQSGAFLFSSETVARTEEFYEKVKHLPYLEGTGKGAGYRQPFWQTLLPDWSKGHSLGLKNWQWIALAMALLIGLILKALTEFLTILFKNITSKNTQTLRHKTLLALESPIGLIVATGFWFVAAHIIKLEGVPLAIVLTVTKITFSLSLIRAIYNLSTVLSFYLERLTEKTESQLDDQLVPLISKALKVFIVVFGVLLTIQNLGFNVMSLMAGLGLGGLAFALAAKDTASNLFGSVMILLDRPFKLGDWIKSQGVEGTVEEIGFRSTRVRTFYNSLISVPNSSLANSNIDNMGERPFRRTNFTLGVTYDTPGEKIIQFITAIEQIIESQDCANKTNYHVKFSGYGDSSLNIMVYFHLKVADWKEELDTRQAIYLQILSAAEKLGVSFAFPSQSVYIEQLPKLDKHLNAANIATDKK